MVVARISQVNRCFFGSLEGLKLEAARVFLRLGFSGFGSSRRRANTSRAWSES